MEQKEQGLIDLLTEAVGFCGIMNGGANFFYTNERAVELSRISLFGLFAEGEPERALTMADSKQKGGE